MQKVGGREDLPQGQEGSLDFKWQGWLKDFVGFEIFDSGIFEERKIWQVFFLVAWFMTVPVLFCDLRTTKLVSFLEIFKAQKFSMEFLGVDF